MLTNIVNNAIDALDESNSQSKELKIKVSSDVSYITFIISNNGPAIPEDILNKIFNPFFTTKREDKGTGLGLSIVQQIIKIMGGSVSVTNRSETHNTVDFILKIPVNHDPKDN